jgi:MFS superfamily sulfate permease-like transporter
MSDYVKNLKYDLPASIIVFLVAVPLCLGIALASGASLFSGIIAGIVGGIVVGSLSGSQLGVSGPAAGLAVIVLNAIQDLGAFETFLLAVVIGGVFQIILGFAKAGVIAYFFPNSVIKGMLAGIGVIIFLKQIPHAFGYDKDFEGNMSFNNPDGYNTFSELSHMFEAINTGATVISFVSLAILILWEQAFMKKIKAFQLIQGPLVVVTLGIVMNLLFQDTSLNLGEGHVVAIPVAENFNAFIGQFTLPDFSQIGNPKVWSVGVTIAIVASLETLLCLDATDKLDPFKRVAPANRELKAQGVGNLISGLIGGLPVTQVIVRSSTNIQSGGRTKVSAIVHGILMLFCAFAIPHVLNLIPLSSLAAILFLVGYKLAKPALFKTMYAAGNNNFVPFMTTILGIVFTDLLFGIGLGLTVAILFILYNNYKKPFLFDSSKHFQDGKIHLELAEDVTFINKASIQRTLSRLPNGSKVVIDASKTVNMDLDVCEIIQEFLEGAPHREIEAEVIELNSPGVQNQFHMLHAALKTADPEAMASK